MYLIPHVHNVINIDKNLNNSYQFSLPVNMNILRTRKVLI